MYRMLYISSSDVHDRRAGLPSFFSSQVVERRCYWLTPLNATTLAAMNITPVSTSPQFLSQDRRPSVQKDYNSELHSELHRSRRTRGLYSNGDDKAKSIMPAVSKSSDLSQRVLPTPPLSVTLSTRNRGSAHVTEAPPVSDTCDIDSLLVPTTEHDKRRARPKTRVGRSPQVSLHKHFDQAGFINKHRHIPLCPVHCTTRRRSPSGPSDWPDVMAAPHPSACSGNIPPSNHDPAEDLSEGSSRRIASRHQFFGNALGLKNTNILGLDLYPSPSIYSDLHLPSPSSEHELYEPHEAPLNRRIRRLSSLHIMIPEPLHSQTPSLSPSPVTALWFPPSGAGDICPSPPTESVSSSASEFPEDDAEACATSYHKAGPEETSSVQVAVGGELVFIASDPTIHSPRSPPSFLRRRYIPLPPVSPETLEYPRRLSPIEASFRMMQVHEASGLGMHVVRGHFEQRSNETVRLIATLPQELGAELLSPLPLATAPSLRLEDLEERLTHCLDAVDWLRLSLTSSPFVSGAETHSLCTTLSTALSEIKEAATQPSPNTELLAEAHGKEWEVNYEAVMESLGRNACHFLLVTDQVGKRSPRAHRIPALLDKLWRFARKFEDLHQRLQIFHTHIRMLDMRAELRRLKLEAHEKAIAEHAHREAVKAVEEDSRTRRRHLRAQIRQEKEAAMATWARAKHHYSGS